MEYSPRGFVRKSRIILHDSINSKQNLIVKILVSVLTNLSLVHCYSYRVEVSGC